MAMAIPPSWNTRNCDASGLSREDVELTESIHAEVISVLAEALTLGANSCVDVFLRRLVEQRQEFASAQSKCAPKCESTAGRGEENASETKATLLGASRLSIMRMDSDGDDSPRRKSARSRSDLENTPSDNADSLEAMYECLDKTSSAFSAMQETRQALDEATVDTEVVTEPASNFGASPYVPTVDDAQGETAKAQATKKGEFRLSGVSAEAASSVNAFAGAFVKDDCVGRASGETSLGRKFLSSGVSNSNAAFCCSGAEEVFGEDACLAAIYDEYDGVLARWSRRGHSSAVTLAFADENKDGVTSSLPFDMRLKDPPEVATRTPGAREFGEAGEEAGEEEAHAEGTEETKAAASGAAVAAAAAAVAAAEAEAEAAAAATEAAEALAEAEAVAAAMKAMAEAEAAAAAAESEPEVAELEAGAGAEAEAGADARPEAGPEAGQETPI
eukprot:TRINITY_DN12096_c0_g9_i1.p1 TRINITY_DN12096_c0_g9~~TRINITY_DN12096_c0_g9_i1.p1  ORF type:complete len:461 (+),score=119.91 TRINITY_DN12096_c0_g9_i1:46-1383(+)